ncbi:MAG: 2,3-bisphosphoglycerate-dependent phosphoglycerate mutase, partial [Chloroflexota bacterium]|nr:2,3-bisphosphoglycerate-dependent phosphoglycerate mutase [Chloroflexota bacterium]
MSDRRERRLYLIRHGRASHSSTGELETPRGLVADPPLDEAGVEQAETLTRRLLKMPRPAGLYVSPLARARQTVVPYERETGLTATVLDDVAEWFGGDWEFKEFEELIGEHPEMPSRVLMQDPVFELAPGAESKVGFQGRVVPAVEAALDAHPDGDVWIVCHGGVINVYLSQVLGLHPQQELFFLPPNTSLNTLRVVGDQRFVWFIADDTHITQPELYA